MGGFLVVRSIANLVIKICTVKFRLLKNVFSLKIKNIISRVHKLFMVFLAKIDSIERDRIKIKEVYSPISETCKKAFLALIHPSAQ